MAQSQRTFYLIVACLLLTLLARGYGQEDPSSGGDPVTQTCLGCICEASSGCNVTIGCQGSVCGPFSITWGYWSDAGKPTINNEPNSADGAYPRCVNDPYCASRAVQGYMAKFGQDCNGDGNINCDDFARIHRLGGYGCSAPVDQKFDSIYKLCMQAFG